MAMLAKLATALALAARMPLRAAGQAANEIPDSEDSEANESSVPAAADLPPPVVEFVGKAPKMKIYPGSGGSAQDTWFMLTFGKIQELDANGRTVNARAIQSLAAEKTINWTQEIRQVQGVEATVTRMELALAYGGSFKEVCSGGGGGGQTASGGDQNMAGGGAAGQTAGSGGGDQNTTGGGGGGGQSIGGGGQTTGGSDAGSAGGGAGSMGMDGGSGSTRRLSSPGSIAIETFVFSEDAVLEYGGTQVKVSRGQLKFNIDSKTWPFCGEGHVLEVNMDIKMPTDGSAKGFGDKAKDAKGPKGKAFRASVGDYDMAMDLPTMAEIDGKPGDCEVALDAAGGKTNIKFVFPAFNDRLVYDPTVGFSDPGEAVAEGGDTMGGGTTGGDTLGVATTLPSTTAGGTTTLPSTTAGGGGGGGASDPETTTTAAGVGTGKTTESNDTAVTDGAPIGAAPLALLTLVAAWPA